MTGIGITALAPLYDNKKSLLFTQLGIRASDGRTTGNFGTGVRTFYVENWMFGANFFFDDDFTGKNRRVGIGTEAWTNYLKLAANTYAGTTDWHSSRDFSDYNEKPADGFDLRAEGYLPAYPQLGARLMYEQYYGDEVALFGKDDLQKNPHAITVGLNYTPVPLVTARVDYKQGEDSMNETEFSLDFHYVIGQSWDSQTSTDQVAARRSLMGSRYDLVDRNNEIVMQYKKKDRNDAVADMTVTSVVDNSPADGTTVNTVTAHAVTTDGRPAANAAITWAVSGQAKLNASSGVTDANGNAQVNLTNTTAENVTVTATTGSIIRSASSSFIQSVAALNLQLTKNNSLADGTSENSGQVTVKDASGKALAGVAIAWAVDNGSKVTRSDAYTDSNGHASAYFTNTAQGVVKLTANAAGKAESVNSTFGAEQIGSIAVSMSKDGSPADGTTINTAKAVVTDAAGKPMSGVSINWTLASTTATATTAKQVTTGDDGSAIISMTDTTIESFAVTATGAGTSKSGNTTASFVTAPAVLTLTAPTNNSPADGVTRNVVQLALTQNGKPVSGASVTWTKDSTNATFSTAATVNTNASGLAAISILDTVAETVNVTATVNGVAQSIPVTFASNGFGPITIAVTPDTATINIDDAYNGTGAVVEPYNGMAAGDTLVLSSYISGDVNNKTFDYTSPVHTVTAGEVGQPITMLIPPEYLLGINGDDANNKHALLNMSVAVTHDGTAETGTTAPRIDTCAPGDTTCEVAH